LNPDPNPIPHPRPNPKANRKGIAPFALRRIQIADSILSK